MPPVITGDPACRSGLQRRGDAEDECQDREALIAAQRKGDVLKANNVLWDAFFTDVRDPLAELRTERGLPPDPFASYIASGEDEQRAADRVGGEAQSW